MKISFEFILYLFEYEHFKLDILCCKTPGILGNIYQINRFHFLQLVLRKCLGDTHSSFNFSLNNSTTGNIFLKLKLSARKKTKQLVNIFPSLEDED